MAKTTLSCLFFLLTVTSASAQLISNIITPAQFQVVDSTLNISVNLIPADPSLSVKAWVGSRTTALAIDAQNGIGSGSLSISGLVQDTLTLFVAATDASLNTDTVSVRFIYDLPPVLSIQQPINWSNARPTLPVHAICKDNSSCTITLTVGMNGGASASFGTFTDSINTTVDLSAFDGNFGTLYFTATDSRGQHDSKGAQILVDNSPYLQEIFTAQDQIIDFNYNKVFVPSSVLEGPGSKTRIVDITSHDSTILPNLLIDRAFITPFGAFLGIQDSTNLSIHKVGDWNRDSLYNIGYYGGGDGEMKIAGNYGILTAENLVLRNFSTLTDTILSSYANNINNDVATNGNVVYSQDNQIQGKFDIIQYQNGISNIISTDEGETKSNIYPSTDGHLVVFDKTDYPFNFNPNNSIYLYNGNREIKLGDFGTSLQSPGPYFFQVNNGYIVFASLDSLSQMQLWRSDSTGVRKPVTPFPVESQLELMDPRGDFTFTRHSTPTAMRRYYTTRSDSIMDIASYMGQAYFRDTSWYLVLGRTLYRVNIHISPDSIQNSSIPISGDSVYTFSTSDFSNNFLGPGQLIKVRIIRLPKFGSFSLNGIPVQVNDEMARSSLPNLSYSPGINFRSDSVFWEGSNGIQYAADSGIINIFSGRLQVKPIFSTIPDHFCKTAAIQKIRILNLPDSTQGTYAMVKIDNILQTIGKDSSISIDPENLSTGSHLIQAIYYNNIGSDTSDVGLSIDSAVIPRVAMSSNLTEITGAATQITITADNVTGGGSSPTYTFGNNSSLSQVLQSESLSNVYTFSSLILQPGRNTIYVKMHTSDSYYSVEYAMDSLDIIKRPGDGIIDPDFPDFPINVNPNPFTSQLRISGLQLSKSYIISLYDEMGRQMVSITAGFQDEAVINIFLPQGVYLIKVFDKQKNRIIGTRVIIAL